MIDQANNWLQSIIVVGKPVFPYVGLVLLVVLAVLVAALLFYLLYRVSRRLPSFLRYFFWRIGVAARRLASYIRRDPAASLTIVSAAFGGTNRRMAMVDSFRTAEARWWQRKLTVTKRPDEPLFLLIGPERAGKSTFASQTENIADMQNESSETVKPADVTWWRTPQGWALEVSDALACDPEHVKFGKMLEILRRMRPERPLDGIVIMLPVDRLLSTGWESWVASYAENSVRIGAWFSYRLPLYVVVSKADVLPGFSSLVALSAGIGKSDDALGIRFDGADSGPSVATCISRLKEQVESVTLNALLAQPSWSRNFGMRNVSGLAERVSVARPALSLAFQKARLVGDTPALPQLRGVFLSGWQDNRIDSFGARTQWGRLAFARNLLEGLFLLTEEALAPSAARVAQERIQRLRIGASVALAFLVLLGWSIHTATEIRVNVDANMRVLESLDGELRVARQTSSLSVVADAPVLEKVLLSSAELDSRTLRFALAPNSWFAGYDDRVQAVVGKVAQQLLLGPTVERLSREAPQLPADPTPSTAGISAYRLEDLPSYRALTAFLDGREQVFSLVDTSDKIAKRKRLSYGGLVGFLGYRPDQFKRLGLDWETTIPDGVVSQFMPVGQLRQQAEEATRQALEAHWERLLHEAEDRNPVVVLSDDIAEAVRRLSSGDSFTVQDAVRLGENLQRLKREVDMKGARRVLGSEADAQAFFSQALLRVSGSSVVPIGQSVELGVTLKSRVQAIRSKLAQKEVEGVGLIFASDNKDGPLVLSADFKRFSSEYALYARQPFLQPVDNVVALSPARDQYLEWSLPDLERLRQLVDAYKEFSAGTGKDFDPRLRAGLKRVARSNYERVALNVLKESARLRSWTDGNTGTESMLRSLSAQVTNLSAAAKLYRATMAPDDGRIETDEGVEILAQEAKRILDRLEAQLMIDDPLAPLGVDVAHWLRSAPSGTSLSVSMRADPKERLLKTSQYLRTQYADLAGALFDILDGIRRAGNGNEPMVRLKRLRYALDASEKGGLNNSAQELERYVMALDKLGDAEKCERFINDRQRPILPDDYFSRTLGALDNVVVQFCGKRLADTRQRRYEDFAGWFNTVAAGRPPFVGNKENSAGPPLSVGAVRRVLVRFQEFRASYDSSLGRNAWPMAVGDFITQMDRLTARFLVPTLYRASATNDAPKALNGERRDELSSELPVRGKIRFRPKRDQERGAEQIIDWTVSFGTRRYSHRNGESTFEWHPGEPVEIHLRWAANSTVAPVAPPAGTRNVSVVDKTVVFRYADDWALFDLVRRQRQRTGGAGGEVLLAFSVPTVGPQGRQEALVHIALAPNEYGMDVLPIFPGEAPRIIGSLADRVQ